MSDVNVVIKSIDESFDILEDYMKDLYDIISKASSDLSSSISVIDYEISKLEEENTKEESDSYELTNLIDSLYDMRKGFTDRYDDLCAEINKIYSAIDILISNFRHDMGVYLDKLNKICDSKFYDHEIFNLVIDSNRYPETCEHIRYAIKSGKPEVLTIERVKASLRRKESLKNVKRNKYFDRDEYPLAMFKEGGAKAHVFYLNGKDNRGSGSYISLKLRKLKNGTRVRIRII